MKYLMNLNTGSRLRMMSVLICVTLGLQGCGGAQVEDEINTLSQKTQTLSSDTQISQQTTQETTQQTTQESFTNIEESSQSTQQSTTEDSLEGRSSTFVSNTTTFDDLLNQMLGEPVESTNNNTTSTTSTNNSTTSSSTTTNNTTTSPQVAAMLTAQLSWVAPSQRQNGERLDIYEISGYEVQYRKVGASSFSVLRVSEDGSGRHQLAIEVESDNSYEVLIASYDTEGLYSEYTRRVVATGS